MFTLDTESGFPDVVTISAGWGLGETIVKGSVNPDRYMVFKPLLADPGKLPILEKKTGGKLQKLVLCVDRDSTELKYLFDARNEAVKRMITEVIRVAHEYHCKVGICGQALSDHPEFAEFLVEAGIDSISLNPDSVPAASVHIAAAEAAMALDRG